MMRNLRCVQISTPISSGDYLHECSSYYISWYDRENETKSGYSNLNPLNADDKYIGNLAGAACRRRSAFHRQNHEKRPRIFLKEDKICYKMVYKTLYFG